MTRLDAAVQIRSLRAQLDVLEARMRTFPQSPQHTLAHLRGMLQRETETTAKEIDDVKISRHLHG